MNDTIQSVLWGNINDKPTLFTQLSGGFLIKFSTDGSIRYRGFKMSFKRFSLKDATDVPYLKPCPSVFHTAKEDYQMLPSLDAHFPVNGVCAFVIESDAFTEFQIEYVGKHIQVDFYHNVTYAVLNKKHMATNL
jgi:hypothetical protein